MSAQPEALRLADWLDHMRANGTLDYNSIPKAAAELRRLHEQNADYANTIDGLIISSCADVARIVGLEDLRDELLGALKGLLNSLAETKSGDFVVVRDSIWIEPSKVAIAKAEGDIDASS